MLNPTSPLPLKDPTLFRQANYIDGRWVEAESGKTIAVKNARPTSAIAWIVATSCPVTRAAQTLARASIKSPTNAARPV